MPKEIKTPWGKLIPSEISLLKKALPIGLANNLRVKKNIKKNTILTWDDVEIDTNDEIVKYRKNMEKKFKD